MQLNVEFQIAIVSGVARSNAKINISIFLYSVLHSAITVLSKEAVAAFGLLMATDRDSDSGRR